MLTWVVWWPEAANVRPSHRMWWHCCNPVSGYNAMDDEGRLQALASLLRLKGGLLLGDHRS